MKIAVLGTIIDTNNIYTITPINKLWLYGETQTIGFTISLFNKTELKIYHPTLVGYQKCQKYKESDEEWAIRKAQIEKQLTTIRNVIVAYWSENQSDIPKIEFI